jgi:hypothetical protein
VFIKGYRPAPRHLYPRSIAAKIRNFLNRSVRGQRDQDVSPSPGLHVGDLADDVESVTPLSLEMPVSLSILASGNADPYHFPHAGLPSSCRFTCPRN